MAVTYSNTVKDNRMTQVLNAIDGGAGAGYIEICSAAYASVLATITLADPCGSVGSQALTLTMPKSDTNADASGTAAIARIKDSVGNIIVSGLTVGAGSGDINLSSVAITIGDTVTLNSAVITHAA
jgi:hypothetical protein